MQRDNGSPVTCASCRHQRKKCTENCILAPYFPLNKSKEFQAVHKLFGVSNITKIVNSLDVEDRQRAVDSLVWDATCRQNDPVLGPYGEFTRVLEELKWYKTQFGNNLQPIASANNMSYLDNRGLNTSTNSTYMCMNKNRNTSAALVPANSYPGYNYESLQSTDRFRDEISYNYSSIQNMEISKEDSNNSSVILPQQYGVQHMKNPKEESNNGLVILPQHYTMTGFNQPYYQLPAGQYLPSTDAKP